MNQQDILKRTSIINVKNKLGLVEIFSKKDIVYVRCPFCNSTKGAMKLNVTNNSYICKNCEQRGYSIGLYAKMKLISNKEAYNRLIMEEADINNNLIASLMTNEKKNSEELDIVYQALLDKLELTSDHTMKLLKYGFTIEQIEKVGFKTIPTNENVKTKICKELIKEGIELSGTPGFYKDKNFKWNFKSHNGIFIPIIDNCKITSLRIHLDKEYNTDTTDIWFSSSQENEGTKINNNIMILFPENKRIQIMNDTKERKNIIIASEMILAYKLANRFKDTVVIRNSKCYLKNGN